MPAARPNILFAIADDASHMSAYGHRFVQTPHFDRVAANGVLFTNAFTTNPKCAPSRASILTGRHTWQLEEACNHWNVWPSRFDVYPDILADAGYHVGYTGKGWAPGDWRRSGRSANPAGPEYSGRTLSPPSSTISEKDYPANFRDFLDARPDGAPFCFWYGGHEPHRPYEPGEGAAAGRVPRSGEVPPYLPPEEVVRSDLADYAFEVEWFDAQLGAMLAELESRGELDDTLVVVTSDNGMPFPRVKGQMYDYDFRLPFAMMWLGRTGAPDGETDTLELRGSDRLARGRRVLTDMISFTDIAPTFLEAAGVTPPPGMSGRSFLSLLDADRSGRHDPHRDRVCMGRERHDLGREGDVGYPVRCIRTDEFLYVWNLKPHLWPAGNPETGFTGCDSSPTKTLILQQHEQGDDRYFGPAFGKRPHEELYAVARDPFCLDNLATDPDYSAVKTELHAELRGYLLAQSDPRMLGYGDWFDTREYVGEASHSWASRLAGTWKPQRY